MTSEERFKAQYFIDGTGWRGLLAMGGRSASTQDLQVTVAVEADVPGAGEGLHFYYVPGVVPRGYGWVFPAGDELRIGVWSYDRKFDLKAGLNAFLDYLGLEGKPVRGGMIPWLKEEPVVGNVLAAGDAAGHCLPLTAEGIRLALGFGDEAGRALRSVVDGESEFDEAAAVYRGSCDLHGRSFEVLRFAQHLIGMMPDMGIHLVARGLARPAVMSRFLRHYLALGAPSGRVG